MRIVVILTNDNVKRICITAEPCAYIRTFVRQITGRQWTKELINHSLIGGTQRASSMVDGEKQVAHNMYPAWWMVKMQWNLVALVATCRNGH